MRPRDGARLVLGEDFIRTFIRVFILFWNSCNITFYQTFIRLLSPFSLQPYVQTHSDHNPSQSMILVQFPKRP